MTTLPPEVLHSLGLQAAGVGGFLLLYIFFKIIHLRMTIGSKVGCYFQEASGNMTFELIQYQREPRDNEPVLVSKRDKLGYRMETQIQRRILYPQGGWRFMQENIPAQCYVRGHYDPVDWYKQVDSRNPLELAVMMKNAKNTAVATDVINSISDRLGGLSIKNLQTIMVVGLIVLGLGLSGVGYLTYRNYEALQTFTTALKK